MTFTRWCSAKQSRGSTPSSNCRGVVAALVCALLLEVAFARHAHAQDVRVRVVDSTSATPLSGALVALLDARGALVAEGITSENGYRTFPVPSGTYRVRVRRIGYRPYLSPPLDLAARAVTVAVESQPVVLSSIVISARSSCRSLSAQRSQALATVWGEATKALEAAKFTIADVQGVGRAWTYEKTSRADGTQQSDTSYFTVADRRPFSAVDPDSLARVGYVLGNAKDGWQYFGPDETVLLSPSFAATHCFRLVRDPTQPGLIGLSFEPTRARKVPDIAGVVWLDQRSSELRRIVFRYVNAGVISEFRGGGETRFRRLPSGAWIVSSWHLRVPTLEVSRGRLRRTGFQENGGGVLGPG